MNIKIIIVALFFLILSFIGYNTYDSYQNKKSTAARMAETEILQADNVQKEASNPKPIEKEVIIDKPIISQPQDVSVDSIPTSNSEKVEAKNKMDSSICDSVIKLAEAMMRNRQNGVPIATSLEFANNIADGTTVNDAASKITKQIVIDAYSQPSFSTGNYKEDAIREFGAKQYLACLKAFG